MCARCRSNRVRDWVGRCLAEAQFSAGASFVTLTYGTDLAVNGEANNSHAQILMYSDVQKWLKRIRKAGYPLRYFVVGEYGSAKGRAHWHVLLFWTKRVPPVPEHATDRNGGRRCWGDPFWKAGHTSWDAVTPETIRYCVKYVLKGDADPHATRAVRLSRFPIIGAAYFEEWARRHVEQRLPLRSRFYTVPGSLDPTTRKHWNYWMNNATVKYVVASYLRQWREQYGTFPPFSELVEKYEDSLAKPVGLKLAGPAAYGLRPYEKPPGGAAVSFDEKLNVWRSKGPDGQRLFWSYDGDGLPAWVPKIVAPREAARRRRAVWDLSASDDYRAASQPSGRKPRGSR